MCEVARDLHDELQFPANLAGRNPDALIVLHYADIFLAGGLG
jgi:hypothetical protein